MAQQDNTVVRRGYLTVHRNPSGRFIISTLVSKRVWMMLCREGPDSPGQSRMELYRSEDRVREYQPLKVINLDTIRSIQPVERKKAFMVDLLDESMLFQCTSKADMEDWVRDVNRFRGGIDLASGQDLRRVSPGHDVYDVVPDDETFRVKLRKTNSLHFYGHCLLEILRDFDHNLFHIALFTEDQQPPRLIVKWQIDHIRQYGSNQMAFKFQSGSKSSTGVDWFIVDTEHGAAVRIHRAVDYWAKHIVEQIRNTTMGGRVRAPSTPSTRHTSESTSPPWGSSQEVYTSLKGEREKDGLYQDLDQAKGSKQGKPVKRKASANAEVGGGGGGGGSGGMYQALQLGEQQAPSTYQTISPRPQGTRPPTTPPSGSTESGGLYMGLNPDTRKSVKDSTYMTTDTRKS